jgi:two-component system NtrC family sensor kinase
MKSRIGVLFFATLFLIIAVLLWQQDQSQQTQELQHKESLLRARAFAINGLLDLKLKSWGELYISKKRTPDEGPLWGTFATFTISQESAETNRPKTWSLKDFQSLELIKDSLNIKVSSEEIKAVVSNLISKSWSRELQGQKAFAMVPLSNSTQLQSALVKVNPELIVGFIFTNQFWNQFNKLLGENGPEWLLVSHSARAIYHSNFNYIGLSLEGTPMTDWLKEVLEVPLSLKSWPAEIHDNGSLKEIYSMELIPQSNVAIISKTSLDTPLARWQANSLWPGLTALGIGLMGLALLYTLMEENFNKLAQRLPIPTKPFRDNKKPEPKSEDRLSSFIKISSALGHEIRGPLSNVLSQIEIIFGLTKGQNSSWKGHLVQINQSIH